MKIHCVKYFSFRILLFEVSRILSYDDVFSQRDKRVGKKIKPEKECVQSKILKIKYRYFNTDKSILTQYPSRNTFHENVPKTLLSFLPISLSVSLSLFNNSLFLRFYYLSRTLGRHPFLGRVASHVESTWIHA